MKTNLEQLQDYVKTISQNHPDQSAAILSVIEKHYNSHRQMVDDVMKLNGVKGGFAILISNVPSCRSEILALR